MILLVLFLLAVPSAWAGEATVDLIQEDAAGMLRFNGEGALYIDKASFDAMLADHPDAKLRVILVPSRCEARMEEAMKAMEGFIGESKDYSINPNFRAAWGAWASVRRDCWRTP